MSELTVKDMNAGQLGFLVKMQLEDLIASFTQKGKLLITDEAPAIRTKHSMAEFLGIGDKAFCKLYDEGVFEGVVLNHASEPRTFTAFPRALRERYTAYCLGEYKPTPKRHYNPKARTLG
ncbi:MAG: hypothetical protein Q4A61_03475 [Porphyromonadaceae bacterium]|nr:hypothetical protein [Porphyromonadaceae bacterium]